MRRDSKKEILAEIAEIRKSLDSIERMLRESDDEEIIQSDRVRKLAVEAVEAAADNSKTVDLAKFSRTDAPKTGRLNIRRGRKIPQPAAPVSNVPANVPPSNTGNFMSEYNALADKTGVELRNARADFFQRYQVRTFSCVNADARVKTPAPPPEFRDKDGGDFWAIPSALISSTPNANENTYVVYPSVAIRQYTPNHHSERALGEVFNSNFVNGNAYSKIRVEQFAIFTCSGDVWTCSVKGRLRLE
ncbi:MAG: hypothetical protein J5809_02390 [Selenomonadaceae bacterium]|nr:hypothetical protein [Selenomonadaceae bacterium]